MGLQNPKQRSNSSTNILFLKKNSQDMTRTALQDL